VTHEQVDEMIHLFGRALRATVERVEAGT
jgi:hypothetical protein